MTLKLKRGKSRYIYKAFEDCVGGIERFELTKQGIERLAKLIRKNSDVKVHIERAELPKPLEPWHLMTAMSGKSQSFLTWTEVD